MKRIKFTLIHNRTKTLLSDGTALIQIRAYLNGKNRFFSTKIYIEPEFWNDKSKCVKSSHPFSQILNKRLDQLLYDIQSQEYEILKKFGSCQLNVLNIDFSHALIDSREINPQKVEESEKGDQLLKLRIYKINSFIISANGVIMRVCKKCSEYLEKDKFYLDETSKDGLSAFCINCAPSNAVKKDLTKRRKEVNRKLLTDNYVAEQIVKGSQLKVGDVKEFPDLIKTKKFTLLLKRNLRKLNT